MNWKNQLYYGDNLRVLREHIPDESVDLVYLDPPFNSNASYNVLFKEKPGTESSAQIKAFDDTWHWNAESEKTYNELATGVHQKLADLIVALRSFLGTNDMMAYLVMMAARLLELRRVLKPTGSLYLHCDPTASHYLKIVLDAVFGPKAFRTEIIWKRSSAHSDTKQGRAQHGRIHDTIFFYTKTQSWTWNPIYLSYDQEYVEQFYRHIEPESGRRYQLGDLTAAKPGGDTLYDWIGPEGKVYRPYRGRYWAYSKEKMKEFEREGRLVYGKGSTPRYKRYLDEMPGVPLQDLWTDIRPAGARPKERLGYPTQKPEALLERIIKASSNEGDVVLDPFCGCGTAIAVAERLDRRWIGIDITHLAITLMKARLEDTFGDTCSPYAVRGEPTVLEGAKALKEHDPYQFQFWALGLVKAHPLEGKKKGADRGVDGVLYFMDDDSGTPKKIIIQVKGGHINSSHIRDLRGTIERENAVIGAFITLEEPTKPMKKEALEAGLYIPEYFPDLKVPRLQILTIEGLLEGIETLEYPRVAPDVTFKRAEKKEKKSKQQIMFD